MFEELDRLFRLEVSDPRLSDVVPVRVQLSPDLRNAKVYFAMGRGDAGAGQGQGRGQGRGKPAAGQPVASPKLLAAAAVKTVQEALMRVTPFLRARLADVVVMKRIPDLHFHRDRLAESSLRAGELLRTSSPPSAS